MKNSEDSEWESIGAEEDDGDWESIVPVKDKASVSSLESALRGAAQGIPVVGPWADEATGLVESLLTDKTYQQARDESRANYRKAAEENPVEYYGATMAPTLAMAPIKSIPLFGTAVSGLMGAAEGAGASESDNLMGVAADAAISGGLSAATAGIGNKLMKPGKEAAAAGKRGVVSNYLKEMAENQSARALGAERGTIKKLGADKVRQIGRYGLDEGIITPFASTDDLISRNLAKQAEGAGMMNKAYSAIDDAGVSSFNPLEVASKVDEQIGGFYRSPINRGETNQLENTLQSILMRGDGNIPIREAQTLKEELGKVANWKNNLQITDKERMAREAYGIVSSAIDDAAESGSKAIGKDGILEMLQKGKSLYGSSKGAEDLLTNKYAREQGNKMFGLTDSIIGAGGLTAMGPSGLGLVGAKKLGENYGNKVLATSADTLSKKLAANPQMFGKFASTLTKAAQRGGNSLAATHYILQQKDPEYREMIQQQENSEGE